MAPRKQRSNGALANGHAKENGVIEKIEEQEYEEENIFLFLPNLIGYTRVVLAIASLYYMPLHPRTCFGLYSVSCILDALDGLAARKYNQSTTFGAVLDMVTDRCTTSCLLVFLASAFPRFSIIFQILISLDLASHYIHMYAMLTIGNEQSHKKVDENRSWLLHKYYTNRNVLFWLCFFNELFFIGLYLLSFSSPKFAPAFLLPDSGELSSAQPGSPAVPRSNTFTISPWSAGALELARANKLNSRIPEALTAISTLPMLTKQWINVVQLYNASKWLGEGDVAARRKAGLVARKKKTN